MCGILTLQDTQKIQSILLNSSEAIDRILEMTNMLVTVQKDLEDHKTDKLAHENVLEQVRLLQPTFHGDNYEVYTGPVIMHLAALSDTDTLEVIDDIGYIGPRPIVSIPPDTIDGNP